MGLRFPGAMGLAAGFDPCGKLLDRASHNAFGSIEIGSLTLAGNRFARALSALRRQRKRHTTKHHAIVGVSLIKASTTAWEDAPREFAAAMRALRGLADYVTLNPGRERPTPDAWIELVATVAGLAQHPAASGTRTPRIVAKIPSRWVSADDTIDIAGRLISSGADALLVSGEATAEAGHLALLARLRRTLGPSACLISVGGIDTPGTAIGRLRAGATLLQIHGAARRSRRIHWLRQAGASLARAARMQRHFILPCS